MHDEAYWQRARALIERKRKPPLAPRKRKRTWEEMEDRRFFDRLVAPRKERTIFEGFFHELFNEREQQKAFNVLKTIIEDCV